MNAQAEWRISPQAMVTLTLRGDHNSNPICQVNCFANFVAPFNSLPHDPNVPYNQVIRSLHRLFLAPPASSGSCASASHGTPSTRATRWYGTASGSSAITYPGTIAAVVATNTPMKNNFIITTDQSLRAAPGSLFTVGAAASQSLLTRFANGGTVGSITASHPYFRPPNFTTMNNPYKQARYEEWELEVQQALPWQRVASVNYVGNHGYNEIIQNNRWNGYAHGFAGLPSTKPDTLHDP